MAKLLQFLQGHPNPRFPKKCKGRPREIFLKIAQNVNWRLNKILAQKPVPKLPKWPSCSNFCKVTQTRVFPKSAKAGPREIFKKSPKKLTSIKRPKSTLEEMALSCNSYAIQVRGLKTILAKNAVPKVHEWPSYGNFCNVTKKPAFSEKVQTGDQAKCFKNRPKSYPRLKEPKALWCKWHYPLISIHLKCKDWIRFWRKKRLQKCPNGQVTTIFANSP